MNPPERLSPFDAALAAFEIRFEDELTARWQNLESEADQIIRSVSFSKKHSALYKFFNDAQEAIGTVVHEYFQKLLQVATTQRQRLGAESPLSFTQGQILRQVHDFLGVDDKFDETSPPRDNSRLVTSTARLALGVGWLDEAIPDDFVLPRWVDSRWALEQVLSLDSSINNGIEPKPPLSRSETLDWIKGKEFWIRRKVERQIENDCWDGIIEAGVSDISVLDAFAGEGGAIGGESIGGEPRRNSFIKEPTTWAIYFDDETCRLKWAVGLDYISVLLQNPGQPIGALRLQTLLAGPSAVPESASELRDQDGSSEISAWESSSAQVSLGADELVDSQARREVQCRLQQIENEITFARESNDISKVENLQNENQRIRDYLSSSRNVHGRPRVFASESEKARMSITNALIRTYQRIEKQAPKTAAHLRSNIIRGREFQYQGASNPWTVRRTP